MNQVELLSVLEKDIQVDKNEALPFASSEVIETGRQFSTYLSEKNTQSVVAIDKILSVQATPKSLSHTMGEVLVAKLDAVGSEFKVNMMRAHQEMNKAPDQLSLRDVLKLEYEFAVITLQIDVVGKGVQKAVQNVDTLVKMQ